MRPDEPDSNAIAADGFGAVDRRGFLRAAGVGAAALAVPSAGLLQAGAAQALSASRIAENASGVGPLQPSQAPYEIPNGVSPPIVLNDAGWTLKWNSLKNYTWSALLGFPQKNAVTSARYLQDAIQRMTGETPSIQGVVGDDLSQGIVLTLYADAPAEIQSMAAAALANDGSDAYNANEAHFIRTEAARLLIVTNTFNGLALAAADLMESVDYEVLGMGENWISVPDYQSSTLTFNFANVSGRPVCYIRNMFAVGGQQTGQGTLSKAEVPPPNNVLPDPADDPVEASYDRWRLGTRGISTSMPGFPGHSLYKYHKAIIQHIYNDHGTTIEGFINDVHLGPTEPDPLPEYEGDLWILDPSPDPDNPTVYLYKGGVWKLQNYTSGFPIPIAIDVSVDWVRTIILGEMKADSEVAFASKPNDLYVQGIESEDGGRGDADFIAYTKDRNWYSDYRLSEGLSLGAYVLHNEGVNQPTERWWGTYVDGSEDNNAQTDSIFALGCWLLREYDKWIDTLDIEDRVTSTGLSKKALVRASLYSYNSHDVPPNFNLDSRVRVMVADYPKHRGTGKWVAYKTHNDIAQAFAIMLPSEPSGDYWILSYSHSGDVSLAALKGQPSADTVHGRVQSAYNAGIRAFTCEVDMNHGRLGLPYYLYGKMFYNPTMTLNDLSALRDRWLQRSFGTQAWEKMKEYYDLMSDEEYFNSPYFWAKGIQIIDEAEALIPSGTPEQARLDDLKQHWYFYYMVDTEQATPTTERFKEFVWKGQMSYITPMWMVCTVYFGNHSAAANAWNNAGPNYNTARARYTNGETDTWWSLVKAWRPPITVNLFGDAYLIDGTQGKDVDQDDLVRVSQFQNGTALLPYMFYGRSNPAAELYIATENVGDEIGFKIFWVYTPGSPTHGDLDVAYGIDHYNASNGLWEQIVPYPEFEHSVFAQFTKPNPGYSDIRDGQVVDIRYNVLMPGVYRITVKHNGGNCFLTTHEYDLMDKTYSGTCSWTWMNPPIAGYTQLGNPGFYFYIPKNMATLDFDTWGTQGSGRQIQLYSSLPSGGMTPTRLLTTDDSSVSLDTMGTHRITLNANEKGTVAKFIQTGDFQFPYMFSVPQICSRTPSRLLVPRKIAEADGLTILYPDS